MRKIQRNTGALSFFEQSVIAGIVLFLIAVFIYLVKALV